MERFRIFTNDPLTLSMTQTQKTGTPPADWTWSGSGVIDQLSDVKIEGFHRRSEAGEIFNNPFLRYTRTIAESSGYLRGTDNSNGWWYQNTGAITARHLALVSIAPYGFYRVSDFPLDQDIIDDLRQEILSNLERSKYSFAEDIAEAHKTLASLQGVIFDIGNILRRIPKLTEQYVSSGLKLQTALSKVWLRLRYELRPLLISLENGVQIATIGLNAAIGKRYNVKGYHNTSSTLSSTLTYSNGLTFTRTATCRTKYNVGSLIQNSDPIRDELELLGLGLKDLAPTIWAITRFSFLVDKFVNISAMIRGLQNLADPNIQILAAWVTTSQELEGNCKLINITKSGWSYDVSTGGINLSEVMKSRSPFSFNYYHAFPTLKFADEWETYVDLYTIFGSKLLSRTLRV